MAKFSRSVFFLALLAATALVVLSSGEGKPILGGKTDVPNVEKDKEVQSLGRFSVEQYNQRQKDEAKGGAPRSAPLIFFKVVAAQKQVVAGMKYFLKVSATQGGAPVAYDAVVLEQPWKKPVKQLLDFKPTKN